RPIGGQRPPGGYACGLLERGISARVLARVVVGESIEVTIVGSLIIEQMGDAEVDAGAASEELVAQVTPRVVVGIRLDGFEPVREGDVDLHGAARADGIPACEELPAERYPAGEILVDIAELLLGSRGPDACAIGSPVGGFQIERAVHEYQRQPGPRCALVDGLQGGSPEIGNDRVDIEP